MWGSSLRNQAEPEAVQNRFVALALTSVLFINHGRTVLSLVVMAVTCPSGCIYDDSRWDRPSPISDVGFGDT
jgi:hypothetical protein